jgi:hypothetical protein
MNNEAKTRRSTKSVVLGKGKGKVISYEDIEEARAKRTKKDTIKGKGRRSRKRKITAIEADKPDTEPDTEPEAAYTAKEDITGKKKRGRKRKIQSQSQSQSQSQKWHRRSKSR